MSDKYILNENGDPEPCGSLYEWGAWMQTGNRIIGKTDLPGDVRVSTIFLGLDHSFGGPVPILYETMVFGGPLDQEQERYATKEAALKGHAAWVKRAGGE